jgi:hypothetical protein
VTNLVDACAAKATSTPLTLIKLLHFHNFRSVDALEHKLGNAVALLDLEVGLAMVEQKDLDRAAVVGINDTGSCIDEVLGSETRTRGNAAVCIAVLVFPLML